MRKEMRWRDLLGYFRTWSSLHKYHEVYPEDKVRGHDGRFEDDLKVNSDAADIDVGGGDIAVRFWKDLRSAAAATSVVTADGVTAGKVKIGVDDPLVVEWPLALILVSKV